MTNKTHKNSASNQSQNYGLQEDARETGSEINGDSKVVGLDPGTTTGIVALDINGQLAATKSKRDMAFQEISSFLIEQGRPIIIAADKGKTPGLVKKVAATFGATDYSPESDLSQQEKKEMVDEFTGDFDSHVADALAAAYHAWESYRNLFLRVKKRVKQKEIGSKIDDVLVQVIKQSKPIKRAIEDVKQEKEETVTSQEEANNSAPQRRDKRWWRQRAQNLALELDRAQAKIDNLEEYRQQLKQNNGELKEKIKDLKAEKEEQRQEIIKQEEVERRTELVRRKQKEIERLQEELEREKEKTEGLTTIIDKLRHDWLPVTIINTPQQLAKTKESVILLEPQISAEDVSRVTINKPVQIIIVDESCSQALCDHLEAKGLKLVKKDEVELLRWAAVCVVNPQTLDGDKGDIFSWIKQYKQNRAQSS